MRVLELFSGSATFANIAKERGHEIFTIDIEDKFNPSMVKDILGLEIDDLPPEWRHPDIIWASPPCTCFSVASIGRYWVNGKPKDEKTHHAIKIVEKTLSLIKEINPRFFFIENPRGMLRTQPMMAGYLRRTITYCQYGMPFQKPTDIWTNCWEWIPKSVCARGSPCHEPAPRGTKSGGIQKLTGAYNRGILPRELCLEILSITEKMDKEASQ
jgi:site-specific DNA-cytosine methylase